MTSEAASRQIILRLKESVNRDGLPLDYASAKTGVSIAGLHKILNGKTGRLRRSTAKKLAQFIEEEESGAVSAAELLNLKVKDFREADLAGVDLVGEDLSGADFTRANLRGANLTGACLDQAIFTRADMREVLIDGVTGSHADLMGANLHGAKIFNCEWLDWDLSMANLRDSTINNCILRIARMTGADFLHAEIKNTTWPRGGGRSPFIILPKYIDFSTVKRGCGCHPLMAKLLEQLFPEDPEIDGFINYVLGQPHRFPSPVDYPCYDGSVQYVMTYIPHRLDDILKGWSQYPEIQVVDRFEMGMLTTGVKTVEEMEALRETKYYELFAPDIELLIRKIRNAKSKS